MHKRGAFGSHRTAPWILGLLAVLTTGLGYPAPRARAADGHGPPGYEDAVARGVSELKANNFPEAREEFRRAHALFPNARTLRGLGMVEFELRNYRECARMLEQSLASKVKPLDERLRHETERLLVRARRYLGELHVETDPRAATILLDGRTTALGVDRSLLLEVGEYALEVHAPGREYQRRLVQIKGGERTHVRVALAPLRAELSSPSTFEKSEAGKPHYKKWWVWTVAAVLAIGAGTTAAVFLSGRQDAASSNDRAQTGPALHSLTRF